MPKKRPHKTASPKEESAWHELEVVSWALAGESGSGAGGVSDHLQLDVSVRFSVPVNEVSGGDLLIYSDAGTRGGIVHYDRERRLQGCLWLDVANAQVLATLLVADKPIIISLSGRPFRWRKMFVDRVYWYTKGHPDLQPPPESSGREAQVQKHDRNQEVAGSSPGTPSSRGRLQHA